MLTLRQIEVFRAVMRSGTLVGAARALKVSQPTVTRVIRRTEDQLGVTLFVRSGGRLLPSRHAERFFGEIDNAFIAVNDAIARAAQSLRPANGAFRIGASPSVGRRLLPRILAELTVSQPRLSIQLDVLTVSQVLPFLLDGGGDAAMTLFAILEDSIQSMAIGQARAVLIMPSGGRSNPISFKAEDHQHTTWIGFEPNSVHGTIMESILADAGIRPANLHRARFAETAIGLVEAGAGATIVDEFSAMTIDRNKALKALWPTTRRYDVFLHRRSSSPRAALVDEIRSLSGRVLADSAMS